MNMTSVTQNIEIKQICCNKTELKNRIKEVLLENYDLKTNFSSEEFLVQIKSYIIIAKPIVNKNEVKYEFMVDTQFVSSNEITYNELVMLKNVIDILEENRKLAISSFKKWTVEKFLEDKKQRERQSEGMIEKPCLYISDYIERNKDTYYDMLTRVRTNNDMIAWIKFFLEAVIETSKTAKDKFRKVVELTQEMDQIILNIGVKPDNAKAIIDILYNEPVINRKKLLELTNIPLSTLKGTVTALLENDIIVETTGYTRNQVFAFQKYIDLFLK